MAVAAVTFVAAVSLGACVLLGGNEDAPEAPEDLEPLTQDWASALAWEILAYDWNQPRSDGEVERLLDQVETAQERTTNPAVQALLADLRRAIEDDTRQEGTAIGGSVRDRWLGLALDIVGRRAGTTQLLVEDHGALLVLLSGRHPHVAGGSGRYQAATFEAVPRHGSLEVMSLAPDRCRHFMISPMTGSSTTRFTRHGQPPELAAAQAAVDPPSGSGIEVVRLTATLASSAPAVRVIAWSPSIERGIWLEDDGAGTYSGEYALPALDEGVIEWRFVPVVENCFLGKEATREYRVER